MFFSRVSPQLDFKFNHRIAIIAHGLACKNLRATLRSVLKNICASAFSFSSVTFPSFCIFSDHSKVLLIVGPGLVSIPDRVNSKLMRPKEATSIVVSSITTKISFAVLTWQKKIGQMLLLWKQKQLLFYLWLSNKSTCQESLWTSSSHGSHLFARLGLALQALE